MANLYDQASDREMDDRDAAIAYRRANPVPSYGRAKGSCLYCREDFEPGSPKLYCDGICADRHASRMKSERK